jgi:sugar phosphate isomerase/epimerase
MKLRFACADFTFPLLSHEHALDLIAMMGFEGVDIGIFEDRSHIWPSIEFKDIPANAAGLKKKIEDRGLKTADIFMQSALDFVSVAPNHPDAAVRARSRDLFLKTLAYAPIAGSRHVTVLPGASFAGEPYEESFKRCCDELAWRVSEAKKSGLIFGIEAHIGSIVPDPDSALRLCKSVPGLTLSLDYTHFKRFGMSDEKADLLIPYASHFHARGAAVGRLQTSVKENEIDYKSILAVMKKTDYAGYIGIEYTWNEWENCNRTDNVSETVLMKRHIEDLFNSEGR